MLNATIVLKNHFINYKNSHKYNFIAKVIKHLMKFSNLNSTSFSLFLRKEWIYFSYIYKKTKDTKKCVQTSSTFEKKKNQRKEILWEIITEEEREGSKEIEGVQKQIIIEERGGWLKRRDTRREEEGNETSVYDEKRRRSAWSRKRERRG